MKVHKTSFQSNLNLPDICANSHPTNPMTEIKFEDKCLFLKNQLSEFFFFEYVWNYKNKQCWYSYCREEVRRNT